MYGKKDRLPLNWKLHIMTSQQILHADALDILFENRNKAYGAYALRKHYPKEVAKGLAVAATLPLLLLFAFQPNLRTIGEKDDGPEVVVTQVALPKEVPVLPKPQPPVQHIPVKQQTFTNNLQITDKEVVDPLAAQNQLIDAAVSSTTVDGPVVTDWQPPQDAAPSTAAIGAEDDKPKPEAPLISRSPEFPGGMKAWTAFLNRHLHSPQDLEEGEKKTVLVRFNVAEDGTVTAFQVAQSAGSEFDNEVIRVLKKMPKWMPALQAGQPIAVSFAQQVSFVGGLE